MKKIMLGFVAVCLITFASSAQNDNALIGKAMGAAHECLQNAPSNWDINGSVETIGICFVQGELKRVTLYASFRCHTEVCPKIADRLIATVDFDCDGNVMSVTCN